MSLMLILNKFQHCFGVFIVNSEQANVGSDLQNSKIVQEMLGKMELLENKKFRHLDTKLPNYLILTMFDNFAVFALKGLNIL